MPASRQDLYGAVPAGHSRETHLDEGLRLLREDGLIADVRRRVDETILEVRVTQVAQPDPVERDQLYQRDRLHPLEQASRQAQYHHQVFHPHEVRRRVRGGAR